MLAVDKAVAFAREHRAAFLDDLKTLAAIPSVSTTPAHKGDVGRAADWVAAQLKAFGFANVEVAETAGQPLVYGEHLAAGPDAPTILFYDHFDVQPPDPLGEWTTEPFTPTERGGYLYARGASDSKGQLVAHMKAVESFVKTGKLPVNLKYLVEGEEELGSPSLGAYIAKNKARLAGDFCLNGDSGILGAEVPGILYALRGIACFELRVTGPALDLHSGLFGGAVHNPANVLARLLAGLHDEKGRVTVPGFYDDVRPLEKEEREQLARLPQDEAFWKRGSGAPALFGEEGYTHTERATARPTLDVNGLLSGFTGEGVKTVLPAKASAKFSTRLVPDQVPEKIAAGLRAYFEKNAPPSVRWELVAHGGTPASIMVRDSREVRAASAALETVWGKEPLFYRVGGSVPAVGIIQKLLGVETLMLGFALPDDQVHAPNEKQHIETYHRGIETFIRFMALIAKRD
ncbi:MAG: dipeptidase [Planctomycetes bacterium]|nr:dipeptidase [Planctomycetota bacterium]